MIADARSYALPAASSVLLRGDPFAADEWTPVSILRLVSGNPEMRVERDQARKLHAAGFDYVFRFEGDRMVLEQGPSTPIPSGKPR